MSSWSPASFGVWHCFHVHLQVRRRESVSQLGRRFLGAGRTSNPGPRHRCLSERQGQPTMPALVEKVRPAILTVDAGKVSSRLHEQPASVTSAGQP